ncbi:MAG: OB-fold domain-containing protein [Caenibius sp.]
MTGAELSFVVDGLVEEGADGTHLLGSRCNGCNTLYFPQMASCPNPACQTKVLRPETLPREGTLYSYTIQRYQPPALFRMRNWKPYVLGLVDMGEGVRVMGMLAGVEEDELEIGMSLQVVTEPLFDDPERGAVATYKFAPVGVG